MHFTKLGLIEPLARAVRSEGYTQPTPIQLRAIPEVLAGRDLLGCAQTGTGKTAAFALPILQLLSAKKIAGPGSESRIADGGARIEKGEPHAAKSEAGSAPGRGHPDRRPIRALIVAPTRELASQIAASFAAYGRHTGLRHTVVFGGVSQGPQATALRDGVDILVATPGRLLDLLNQRLLTLKQVEILVLDEADRMLDMGFIHDIRKIIALIPAKRQTLLYSATMPAEIRSLANSVLHHPVEVRVAAQSPAADTVEQALFFVERMVKPVLLEQLLRQAVVTRALIFTRTKHGADKVVRSLNRAGLGAEAIHSNKSQNARTRALDNFKRGKILALVASDIAARGLDVDDISHVINYDMPGEPETYVHRIGRTGRAGAQGQAITFCMEEQRSDLRAIERLIGRAIPVLKHNLKAPPSAPPDTRPPAQAHHQAGQSSGRPNPRQADHRSQGSGSHSPRTGAPADTQSSQTGQGSRPGSHPTARPSGSRFSARSSRFRPRKSRRR